MKNKRNASKRKDFSQHNNSQRGQSSEDYYKNKEERISSYSKARNNIYKNDYGTPNFLNRSNYENSNSNSKRNYGTPNLNNHSNISFNENDFVSSTAFRNNCRPSIFPKFNSKHSKDPYNWYRSKKNESGDRRDKKEAEVNDRRGRRKKDNKYKKGINNEMPREKENASENTNKPLDDISFSIETEASPILLYTENESINKDNNTSKYNCKTNLVFPNVLSPEVKRKKTSHKFAASLPKSNLPYTNSQNVLTPLLSKTKAKDENDVEFKEMEIFQNDSNSSFNVLHLSNSNISKNEESLDLESSSVKSSISNNKNENDVNILSQPVVCTNTQRTISPSLQCGQNCSKPEPVFEDKKELSKEAFLKDFFSEVSEPTLTSVFTTSEQEQTPNLSCKSNSYLNDIACQNGQDEILKASQNIKEGSESFDRNCNDFLQNNSSKRSSIDKDQQNIDSCTELSQISEIESQYLSHINPNKTFTQSSKQFESNAQSLPVNMDSIKVEEIASEAITVYDINESVDIESTFSKSFYSTKSFEMQSPHKPLTPDFTKANKPLNQSLVTDDKAVATNDDDIILRSQSINSLNIPNIFSTNNLSSSNLNKISIYSPRSFCESSFVLDSCEPTLNAMTDTEKSLVYLQAPFSSTQYSEVQILTIPQVSPVQKNDERDSKFIGSASNKNNIDPKILVDYSSTDSNPDVTHPFSVTCTQPKSSNNDQANDPFSSIKLKIESLFEVSNTSYDNDFKKTEANDLPSRIITKTDDNSTNHTTHSNSNPLGSTNPTISKNLSTTAETINSTDADSDITIINEKYSKPSTLEVINNFESKIENVIKEIRNLFQKSKEHYLTNEISTVFKVKLKEFTDGNLVDSKKFIIPLTSSTSHSNYVSIAVTGKCAKNKSEIDFKDSVKSFTKSNIVQSNKCDTAKKGKPMRNSKPLSSINKFKQKTKDTKKNKQTSIHTPEVNLVLSEENWWEAYLDDIEPTPKKESRHLFSKVKKNADKRICLNVIDPKCSNKRECQINNSNKIDISCKENYSIDGSKKYSEVNKVKKKDYKAIISVKNVCEINNSKRNSETDDSSMTEHENIKDNTKTPCVKKKLNKSKSWSKEENTSKDISLEVSTQTEESIKVKNQSEHSTKKTLKSPKKAKTLGKNPYVLLEKLNKSLIERDLCKDNIPMSQQNECKMDTQENETSNGSEIINDSCFIKIKSKKKKKSLRFVPERNQQISTLTPPFSFKKMKPQPGKRRTLMKKVQNWRVNLNEPSLIQLNL